MSRRSAVKGGLFVLLVGYQVQYYSIQQVRVRFSVARFVAGLRLAWDCMARWSNAVSITGGPVAQVEVGAVRPDAGWVWCDGCAVCVGVWV
jgi:hypothetical protein